MKIIPYGRHWVTNDDIKAVVKTLRSDWLTQGPVVREFEEQFAEYVGAKYAVSVSNGTVALHLANLVLGVDASSKVISSPITFAASTNSVLYCGGEVVFADIDPSTVLLDINKVRQLLESHPKGTFSGIIPVDFAGYPVDLEAFRSLADEYGLWIIEDACHAPGGAFIDSERKINPCGNGQYADLSIFSFHPVKHIACGEGGMITTNRKDLYQKLLLMRTHGITKAPEELTEHHGGWYYEMQELGYNGRLPDITCALGLSQLKRASVGIQKRRVIARRYDQAFENTDIRIIKPETGCMHAYHLYVIQTPHRKELYDYLRSKGVYAQVHYVPVHLMPYYKKLGWKKGDLPFAEAYYEQCLSLPMYPALTRSEQNFIIQSIKEFHLCEV